MSREYQPKLDPEFRSEINALRFAKLAPHEIQALKALARKTATPDQQEVALVTILQKLCDTWGNAYRIDSRQTDLLLGRQLVGQQIVATINSPEQSIGKRMIKDLENYDARSSNSDYAGNNDSDDRGDNSDGNQSGFDL